MCELECNEELEPGCRTWHGVLPGGRESVWVVWTDNVAGWCLSCEETPEGWTVELLDPPLRVDGDDEVVADHECAECGDDSYEQWEVIEDDEDAEECIEDAIDELREELAQTRSIQRADEVDYARERLGRFAEQVDSLPGTPTREELARCASGESLQMAEGDGPGLGVFWEDGWRLRMNDPLGSCAVLEICEFSHPRTGEDYWIAEPREG